MHGRTLALQSHSPGFSVNQAHSVNSVVYEYKLCAESNVEVQKNWPPYHVILNLGTHNYQQKCLLGCGTNFENDRTCLLVYTIIKNNKIYFENNNVQCIFTFENWQAFLSESVRFG